MSTVIERIGTAVPSYAVSQQEVLDFMLKAHQLNGSRANRLKVLYRATGIATRHSVIPDYSRSGENEFFPQTEDLEPFPGTKMRQERYRREALPLSLEAVRKCIGDTNPSRITHLITVSCTGMYAPGLDIDLVNTLGLSPNVKRTAINFMGCYAAFNALKVADAFCQLSSEVHVLIVSTELCTLHFQKEPSEDNLLANAIFGDGSAAVLLTNRPSLNNGLVIEDSYATLAPGGSEEMAWNIGDKGFEMKLSSYVPDFIEKNIGAFLDEVRQRTPASRYDYYALHPGGKRILQVLEKILNISADENHHSRRILSEFGNMSSATILFVLESVMQEIAQGKEENKILALAFGPGLTLESMIFRSRP
jgi:predicted naringenin-chalcone synthase